MKFTTKLQARIITDILVGDDYSIKRIPYEEKDGTTGTRTLCDWLDLIEPDIIERVKKNPFIMMFGAKILDKEITKEDTRFFKNAKHLRGFINLAIKER